MRDHKKPHHPAKICHNYNPVPKPKNLLHAIFSSRALTIHKDKLTRNKVLTGVQPTFKYILQPLPLPLELPKPIVLAQISHRSGVTLKKCENRKCSILKKTPFNDEHYSSRNILDYGYY